MDKSSYRLKDEEDFPPLSSWLLFEGFLYIIEHNVLTNQRKSQLPAFVVQFSIACDFRKGEAFFPV